MLSLNEIKREVKRLARLIDTPDNVLPTFGYSKDFARPHLEVDAAGYHYVVVERGQELKRDTTSDLDTLLYNVFGTVTHELASHYEVTHRVEGQDSRRLLFQKQVELLALLSPAWANFKAMEHDKVLQQHPYDDASDARVRLVKELRAQGRAADEAWAMACERYPLPVSSTGSATNG
jgi:hypothetical protein